MNMNQWNTFEEKILRPIFLVLFFAAMISFVFVAIPKAIKDDVEEGVQQKLLAIEQEKLEQKKLQETVQNPGHLNCDFLTSRYQIQKDICLNGNFMPEYLVFVTPKEVVEWLSKFSHPIPESLKQYLEMKKFDSTIKT